MRVLWAPLAMDRVAEIAAHIAEDDPLAAERWVRNLFDRVGQLEEFPDSGRHPPETARPDIRELLFGNYRILYRLDPRQVAILTVRHMKQLLPLKELE